MQRTQLRHNEDYFAPTSSSVGARRALAVASGLVAMCWPSSAFAHDNLGGLASVLLGLLGGFIVGVFVVVWLPFRGVAKALLFLPIVGVSGAIGLGIAVALEQAATNRSNAAYARERENEFARYLVSPLRQAACDADDAALGQYLQTAEVTEFGSAIWQVMRECTLPPGEDAFQLKRPLGFPLLARELYKLRSDRWGNKESNAFYCTMLHELHEKRMLAHLRALRSTQLPIFCSGARDWGWLSAVSTPAHADQASRAAQWDWLVYLKSEGVDFNAPLPPGEPTLLDRVVECGEPRLIRLALESGDQGAVIRDGAQRREAPARWAVRHFAPSDICGLSAYAEKADREDIAIIDSLMPKLTAAVVNRVASGIGQTMLWEVDELARAQRRNGDGGAALFAHLMAHGADPARVDNFGRTFMHGIQITPQLKAELDKLSDEQITLVANAGGDPLLAYSRAHGHTDVVAYLCGRKLAGC